MNSRPAAQCPRGHVAGGGYREWVRDWGRDGPVPTPPILLIQQPHVSLVLGRAEIGHPLVGRIHPPPRSVDQINRSCFMVGGFQDFPKCTQGTDRQTDSPFPTEPPPIPRVQKSDRRWGNVTLAKPCLGMMRSGWKGGNAMVCFVSDRKVNRCDCGKNYFWAKF